MKIQLPNETWMLILGWLLRHQLAKLMGHLLLLCGDRQFTEIIQAFLHDHGKVKLDSLMFVREKQPRRFWTRAWWRKPKWRAQLLNFLGPGETLQKTSFANTPMPGNVDSFRTIYICHLDTSVLDLLRRMQRLFINVNLNFIQTEPEVALNALRLLLPHVGGIQSLTLDPVAFHFFPLLFPSSQHLLLGAKLLRVPVLNMKLMEDVFLGWLFNARADGQPRVLLVEFGVGYQMMALLLSLLQEPFLNATTRSPFFIRLRWREDEPVPALSITNTATDEKMTVHNRYWREENVVSSADQATNDQEGNVEEDIFVLISRYQLGVTNEWILQMEDQHVLDHTLFVQKDDQQITLTNLEIGNIDGDDPSKQISLFKK